jgi:competence protein ComEC
MRQAYGTIRPTEGHHLGDRTIVTLAVVASVAARCGRSAWLGTTVAVAVLVVVAASSRIREERRGLAAMIVLAVAVCGAWRSEVAWDGLVDGRSGPYEGWVRIVDDPQPYGGATRVIVEIDGQRYESWHRGRATRLRVGGWRAGERVVVAGMRRALEDERRARVAWQHVVGEFDLEWASDTDPGRPVDRASNRLRSVIERGASVLPGDDAALFRGLVIGDDRDQPIEMIQRFRASGLSHLTAVSGQNVAFLLAAAGPVLVRLRPWWRWSVTLGLIVWFVSLTRFEPSIVRAGAMAILSATGFVLGRERAPTRLLCWAVVALLLIDPLLAWSIGFWLSVGATAGVVAVAPWLTGRLGSLGPLAAPVGVTLGAQAGVVVPALLVFGRLPLVSVPANLLAVPVAGFVMLYGLPAGLLAGAVPPIAPVVMFPCRLGVRWVDTVAALGERLEPDGRAVVAGWVTLVMCVCAAIAVGARPDRAEQRRDRRDRCYEQGRHGRASADR